MSLGITLRERGKKGETGIVDVKSTEELHALIAGAPDHGFGRLRIYALTTFDTAKKGVKTAL